MANYEGNGRSNYVNVTDVTMFENLCGRYNLQFIDNDKKGVGCYAGNENGDPAPDIEEDEDGEEIEYDGNGLQEFLDELVPLLLPDEVFIWQHIGNENQRYLIGYSIAINSNGERVEINLDDIYKKAAQLGKNISLAQY